MKAPIYLLAAILLLAASCGDSNNKGPEYLFVQTSDGATLTDSTLTLTGISPNTGWFTDRPYREAGQIPTEEFLTLWDEGENSFADDPPNADFTCAIDGEVVNYVVELNSPRLEGDELTYGARRLGDAEVDSEITCEAPHIFLDDSMIGCGLVKMACTAFTIGGGITTAAGCVSATAAAVGACEVVGLGPEDPLSDACAALAPGIVATACGTAVLGGEVFGVLQCNKALGCGR